jgi:aspartokinase
MLAKRLGARLGMTSVLHTWGSALTHHPHIHMIVPSTFNRSTEGTVVERKTRFVILSKITGCTAGAALEGFTRQMKRLPVALRRSMTYDHRPARSPHPSLPYPGDGQ